MPTLDKLTERFSEHSKLYRSSSARHSRSAFRARMKSEIKAFGCIDGRVDIPLMMQMPAGVISVLKTPGAKFDVGYGLLNRKLTKWTKRNISEQKFSLAICTYHFASGDTHRCCAAHSYNTEAARAAAERLAEQIERVYDQHRLTVGAVVIGIDTDKASLVFHNAEKSFYIADALTLSDGEIYEKLAEVYPHLQKSVFGDVVLDLTMLAKQNRDYARAYMANSSGEFSKEDHTEYVVIVGEGFASLSDQCFPHLAGEGAEENVLPNFALVVSPVDDDLSARTKVALSVMAANVVHKKIDPSNGILLAALGTFDSERSREVAVEESRFFMKIIEQALDFLYVTDTTFRDFYRQYRVRFVLGIVDEETRELLVFESTDLV